MSKLPGLWVQIRNLQHLAEDRTGLGSNAWAEYSFLFLWLVAATLAMVNLQQTLVKLQAAWTGQDRTWAYTRHSCSAPPAPIRTPSSAYTMNLVLWEGLCRGLRSCPQPSRALHHQAAGWLFWLVPACPPPSIASPGQE